jgi:hypothetical protein
MASNYEQHPIRESLKDFGVIAIVLGGLVLGAELLLDES